tara:strand:- start:1546 stop:2001 length:456 start_codon:yes stop_codon:yes gene_type:complete
MKTKIMRKYGWNGPNVMYRTTEGYYLVDVSTKRQTKKGTVILQLSNGAGGQWLFGSYESGYVRKLPSRSNSSPMYQLNQVRMREVGILRIVVDMESGEELSRFISSKYRRIPRRMLIEDRQERLKYIGDFVDRNFGREKTSPYSLVPKSEI